MTKQCYFLLLTTFLIACDPYGGYEYQVENKSSQDLNIIYTVDDSVTQKKLKPNDKVIIGHFESINGLLDLDDNFLRYFDSLSIQPINGTGVAKDIMNRKTWHYKADKTGRLLLIPTGENRYRLTITNSDIAHKK